MGHRLEEVRRKGVCTPFLQVLAEGLYDKAKPKWLAARESDIKEKMIRKENCVYGYTLWK